MGVAYTGFWRGNVRERDHWGDPGVDGRILNWIIKEAGCGSMEWNELAQDKEGGGLL
jgi:hypothetical protein